MTERKHATAPLIPDSKTVAAALKIPEADVYGITAAYVVTTDGRKMETPHG